MSAVPDEPRFHRTTPLAAGLRRLLEELGRRLELDRPVTLYLAGGMAVHLYTGSRVTTDVDAEFDARIAVPSDLVIQVVLENGRQQALYFDTNYNPMFALMHEEYQEAAIELDLGIERFRTLVLSPLDLAVSKLARFADNDREDVRALVRAGLVTAAGLESRAREALAGFVGGASMVRANVDDAVRDARAVEAGRSGQPGAKR